MTFKDIALECAAGGWYVFPCKPGNKQPDGLLVPHGFKDATIDPDVIEDWWARRPDANVGIACGLSNLAVLDIDNGLETIGDIDEFFGGNDIPYTYGVRTGRRPGYGLQLYFEGAIPDVGLFNLGGCSGQVKSLGGYVMAAGCVHPSGERYEVAWTGPVAPTPPVVRALRTVSLPVKAGPMEKIPAGEGRHHALASVAGKLRNSGLDADAIFEALIPINPNMCAVPVSDDDLRHIADSVCRYAVPEPEPAIVLGGKVVGEPEKPVDWRTRYLSYEELRDAPEPSFLIEGFLAKDSITALTAPVSQRKSLTVLNVIHALCTGKPLFGHFKVIERPSRILYLCPEMGKSSIARHLKNLEILEYIRDEFLYVQTMDEEIIPLDDLGDELPGALVILDTLTRFVKGDQNSAELMSIFADKIFRVRRGGCTILLLHHAAKGASAETLSLDTFMRGSTELAAFITSCWATALQDMSVPARKSASVFANVKQRDYGSDPFTVTTSECGLLTVAIKPGDDIVSPKKAATDERTARARELMAGWLALNPKMTVTAVKSALQAAGCGKGDKAIREMMSAILGTGVTRNSSLTRKASSPLYSKTS